MRVGYTDDVLFGDIWKRADRAARDRSVVTVAYLTASGNTDQPVYHLGLARENGVSEAELIEAITHLAFYAGWPKTMAAMAVAKKVFRDEAWPAYRGRNDLPLAEGKLCQIEPTKPTTKNPLEQFAGDGWLDPHRHHTRMTSACGGDGTRASRRPR